MKPTLFLVIQFLIISADLIGQNRLGNNVRFYRNRFQSHNEVPSAVSQIKNFLEENSENFNLGLKQLLTKNRPHGRRQKMRIRHYKNHF